MLLVIFGAGASYDSVNLAGTGLTVNHQYRPPLAASLFDSRSNFNTALDRYPDVTTLASRLRRATAAGKDFEQTLEAIEAEYANDPRIGSQLGALRFYLRDTLKECDAQWFSLSHGVTNYVDLVSQLENWRAKRDEKITYVTFNYDTLLERGITHSLGLEFDSMDSYISSQHTSVIKPHGSVNWAQHARLFSAPSFERNFQFVIRHFGRLELDNSFEFVGNDNRVDSPEDGYYKVPAVSIPIQSKTKFMCPPVHLGVLGRNLEEVTKILIVGWRANEDHFKALWKEHYKKPVEQVLVTMGSRTGAEVVNQNLRSIGIHTSPLVTNGGFTDMFDSDEFLRFLA